MSFCLQIGTRFDGGVPLIWSLIAEDLEGVVVPRPKVYRRLLATYAGRDVGAETGPDELNAMLGLDPLQAEGDLHFVLRVVELMEPPRYFCPAGDWFYDIGPRAAAHARVFAPAPVTFMISLCNPAQMLSQAMASGDYPDIDIIAPDPFALQWAEVLRALRESCPDVPIIAWNAAEAPMIWGPVIAAAAQRDVDFSDAAQMQAARGVMNEEGAARLAEYLDTHDGMPDALRAQVISIFLKRFAKDDVAVPEVVLPGWDAVAQARMDQQFADDLRQVADIDGVTLITL